MRLTDTYLQLAGVAAGGVLGAVLLRWLLHRMRRHRESERGLRRGDLVTQMLLAIGAYSVGLVVFLTALFLVLPVSDSTKGQVLTITGLLITALLSITSGTLIANSMAGITLLTWDTYRLGDRIRVGDHHGDVVDITLQRTLIATEQGNLIAVPNSYLMSRPTIVNRGETRRIGLVVSTSVDYTTSEIAELLHTATESAGHTVAYMEMEEYTAESVTWRVVADSSSVHAGEAALKLEALEAFDRAGIPVMALRGLPSEINPNVVHS